MSKWRILSPMLYTLSCCCYHVGWSSHTGSFWGTFFLCLNIPWWFSRSGLLLVVHHRGREGLRHGRSISWQCRCINWWLRKLLGMLGIWRGISWVCIVAGYEQRGDELEEHKVMVCTAAELWMIVLYYSYTLMSLLHRMRKVLNFHIVVLGCFEYCSDSWNGCKKVYNCNTGNLTYFRSHYLLCVVWGGWGV